jgi:hypothetical protein
VAWSSSLGLTSSTNIQDLNDVSRKKTRKNIDETHGKDATLMMDNIDLLVITNMLIPLIPIIADRRVDILSGKHRLPSLLNQG